MILSKKGEGKSLFIHFLIGELRMVRGSLKMGSKIAFLSSTYFFCHETIADNFIFYNKNCDVKRAYKLYVELGLDVDLSFTKGIHSKV